MKRKQQIIQTAIASNFVNRKLTSIGIMDFDGLKETIKSINQAFPENFVHTFAVKANPLVQVLKQIKKNGMGAEVASPGELMIALHAGFIPENIIYDSPTKTISDLTACIKQGISLNIDNLQELSRIDQLMLEFPDTKSVIGFRINPQVGSGTISSTSTATSTSKFGYALNDNNNRTMLLEIYKNRPWLKSIHTHTGSQGCSLELMTKGVFAITELAEEINAYADFQQILRLDIGGGLPVNFTSEEISPTFDDYTKILRAEVPLLFSQNYQVKTEFGRAIVAKNGIIITRVEYTKVSGGRHIAATHAGAHILTRTSLLPESWPVRVTGFSQDGKEITAAIKNMASTDISGPCCFAGDLICKNQNMPELSPNDYVMIHDTGGYYFSNHFDYNSLPAVAVYSISGKNHNMHINCIRQSESLEDVLNKMQLSA